MSGGRVASALAILSASRWLTAQVRLGAPRPRCGVAGALAACSHRGRLRSGARSCPSRSWPCARCRASANAPLAWVVYTWLGFALYLFLLTVAGRRRPGPRRARRRAAGRSASAGSVWPARSPAAVGALPALIGLGGVVNVARGFDVRRVRIPLARLPQRGVRLHHRAAHRRPRRADDRPRVHRAASCARPTRSRPTSIVITGDLVDGSVEQLGRARRAARASCARRTASSS